MGTERVVITGLGTINAIAGSVSEFHGALRNGVCGIGPVTVFDTTDFKTHTGGEVKRFAPQEMIPAEFSIKRMSRSDIMAMAAALEALKHAGLFPVPDGLLADVGVVIGGVPAVCWRVRKPIGSTSRIREKASVFPVSPRFAARHQPTTSHPNWDSWGPRPHS